ncbi:MAG TPA: bacillithiol biosynthesis cysteine-adding enzyme BshC [Chitinophagaceae bacterium]
MNCKSTNLPFRQTGFFSRVVLDYLDQSSSLRGFYEHDVNIEGIKKAIENRKAFPTDRSLLQTELSRQYKDIQSSERVSTNIQRLGETDTFTVCTAHQPGLFTGNLYFVYKILHAIRLADFLSKQLPQYHFVPVFYMGCEDADLDELGHVHLDGQKLVWDTKQTGAVGRMNTRGIDKLIHLVEGQLGVHPYGKELADLLRRSYLESPNIQIATFKLVNELFGDRGLVVLIPDNANLKRVMKPVFEEDLTSQVPSNIVSQSVAALDKAGFKVQAQPREINLFYLKDNLRQRIIQNGTGYKVHDSQLRFSTEELRTALENEPDVFSPNVILRGIFQETILPDVAFIGGGGELAYWLELKSLFENYNVPFPVLILRNSFLVIEKKWKDKMEKMGLTAEEIFKPEQELTSLLVKKESANQLSLEQHIQSAQKFYGDLKQLSGKVDVTLADHVGALEATALKKLQTLEKKLLRAEKKNFADHLRQVSIIRQALFPNDSLQERVENFMPYYAKWGKEFFNIIYDHSEPLQDGFVVISTDSSD